MTIEQIAESMNRKPNTVKVWLHRARKKLAQEFKS
jgi:DNA-directed RNA polymerase specialized sigma24 family protein